MARRRKNHGYFTRQTKRLGLPDVERVVPPKTPKRRGNSEMGLFKDEHILIIAPGSETTLAQLGLPEVYTPAKLRIPTRMFPGENPDEYEPHRIRQVTTTSAATSAPAPSASEQPPKEDVDMKDAAGQATAAAATTENAPESAENAGSEPAQEIINVEDVLSDEGAIYPIQHGRIVNRKALFALLQHVHNLLSPPLHTPILIVAEPRWTRTDYEDMTKFVFEQFNTPAFAMVDSSLAIVWAHGQVDGVVVDIGKDKTDISVVLDGAVQRATQITMEGSGGSALTDRLYELLRPKGFTREMCEQLKRSDITEILPHGTPLPGSTATAFQGGSSAGTAGNPNESDSGPADSAKKGEEEGVLDVATIVSGNTSEYLANIEKDKSAAKKAAADPKQPKLLNSQKETATFQFEEFVQMDQESHAGEAMRYKRNTREITVGVERFLAATRREKSHHFTSVGIVQDIAERIQNAIRGCDAKPERTWEKIHIVGGGSRVKGFSSELMEFMKRNFIIHHSSAMSDIPSSFTTPQPTGGTNTPSSMTQGQGQAGAMFHPAAQGVNPLLVAATHSNPGMPAAMPNPPGYGLFGSSNPHFSQSPTTISRVKPLEYHPEFKAQGNSNAPGASIGPGSSSQGGGPEEAIFLGAQVCARIYFSADPSMNTYVQRVMYNDLGPQAIRNLCYYS